MGFPAASRHGEKLRGPWRCTKRALGGDLLADIRRRPSNKDVVDPVIIHSIIVPRERVAPLSPTGATAVIHRGFDLLRCPNPDVFAFGFVRRPSRRITLSRRVEKTRSPPSRDRHSTSRQAVFRTRIPSRIVSLPACTPDSPSDASRILAFLRDYTFSSATLLVYLTAVDDTRACPWLSNSSRTAGPRSRLGWSLESWRNTRSK